MQQQSNVTTLRKRFEIKNLSSSTTVKRLTPRGRGAVASIRLRGEIDLADGLFHAANNKSVQQQELNRICYGDWGTENQEDLVCVRINETTLELHCHGGDAAVERILGDLQKAGAVLASQGQYQNGLPLAEEFNLCLQKATTKRTAHEILRQSKLFPEAIEQLKPLTQEERSLRIRDMLTWSDFGEHLIKPWQVVLCGPPNVGKSSLINALVGFSRSVVFDQPGTTRDVVTVQTALEGWPIEFSDTAGLRETEETLEAIGIKKAKERIVVADLLLIIVDAQSGITQNEEAIAAAHENALLVVNKIDSASDVASINNSIQVSAITGKGIDKLAALIVSRLVPEIPEQSQAFPMTAQQVEMLNQL